MDTQLGYWRWKFFRWNEHPNPYRNRSDLALTWLNQFQGNSVVMAELQQILNTSSNSSYTIVDDATVLQQIAEKMATGEIQVCTEVCGPVALKSVGLLIPDEEELDLSQYKTPPVTAPAPAPAPATEESTLGPNNDPECQSQALKDAAETGAPFCEECEKNSQQGKQEYLAGAAPKSSPSIQALERDPSGGSQSGSSGSSDEYGEESGSGTSSPPDPQTRTLSSDCDEATQARTLKEASRKGVAFCEECERARAELAQGKQP